jgi:hypothetical protein
MPPKCNKCSLIQNDTVIISNLTRSFIQSYSILQMLSSLSVYMPSCFACPPDCALGNERRNNENEREVNGCS